MSPLCIKMLLHYYAHAMDYRDEAEPAHACSGAVKEAIEFFLHEGLIREVNPNWESQLPGNRNSQYSTSPKGNAMVEHLCAVQVPIIKWVQP